MRSNRKTKETELQLEGERLAIEHEEAHKLRKEELQKKIDVLAK